MKAALLFAVLLLAFTFSISGQVPGAMKPAAVDKGSASGGPDNAAALGLAKGAVAAHGGDKLKHLKTLVLKGSVDLNVMGQAVPGAFSMAISGDKYRYEINTALPQQLKQICDGHNTYSSIQGFSLPPITSLGFPLLPHVGDAGYVVTAANDAKKKRKGFRITTPDGFYTDFFLDDKTGLLKSYESSYDVNGQTVTTSVEIDESEMVDGITVPKRFSQRFDLGTLTAYANFKAKQILINSPIEDSAFALPN